MCCPVDDCNGPIGYQSVLSLVVSVDSRAFIWILTPSAQRVDVNETAYPCVLPSAKTNGDNWSLIYYGTCTAQAEVLSPLATTVLRAHWSKQPACCWVGQEDRQRGVKTVALGGGFVAM